MDATVISPYAGTGVPNVDPYRPLVFDEFLAGGSGGQRSRDVTDRNLKALGTPSHNLCVYELYNISGSTLAAIKSDNRFFVLEPGPGYSGNALATWLDGKGANGHGVSGSDTAAQARAKLIAFCREG